jgi:hypothetical protein
MIRLREMQSETVSAHLMIYLGLNEYSHGMCLHSLHNLIADRTFVFQLWGGFGVIVGDVADVAAFAVVVVVRVADPTVLVVPAGAVVRGRCRRPGR